jgi:hypothetical protein
MSCAAHGNMHESTHASVLRMSAWHCSILRKSNVKYRTGARKGLNVHNGPGERLECSGCEVETARVAKHKRSRQSEIPI